MRWCYDANALLSIWFASLLAVMPRCSASILSFRIVESSKCKPRWRIGVFFAGVGRRLDCVGVGASSTAGKIASGVEMASGWGCVAGAALMVLGSNTGSGFH